MRKNWWLIISLLFIWTNFGLFFYPGNIIAYQTQRVFVVSIDGIRNTEAFDAPDPSIYIPQMWNVLRPQGTLYKNFYNLAETYTTPGNNTIINGAWEFQPNIGLVLNLRAKSPTIFEYYRKAHPEIPKEKFWAVVGKSNVRLAEHSLHPFYGGDYGAYLYCNTVSNDSVTWEEMKKVMDTYHPILVFLHLGEVDKAGHTGDTLTYFSAIRQADSIVSVLWDKIQSDPFYKDSTSLLITSDHGRHSDENGGFKGHGGICSGCKRLPLLALGLDIKKGEEVLFPHQQIDICPTVGELLNFETPLSGGYILNEMLISPLDVGATRRVALTVTSDIRLTNSPGRSEEPQITVNKDGIFVVWTDNRSGVRGIYYKKSTDFGATWSLDLKISSVSWEARAPAIASDSHNVYVVWQDYKDGNWSLYFRKYNDISGWSDQARIATSIVEIPPSTPTAMLWEPEIALILGKVSVSVPVYPLRLYCLTSTDDGASWSNHIFSSEWGNSQGISVSCFDSTLYASCYQIKDNNWEIFFNKSTNGGENWVGEKRLTTDNPTSDTLCDSFDPSVLGYDSLVHLVWSDNKTGRFQIFYRKSSDFGNDWSDAMPLVTSTSWKPNLVKTKCGVRLFWEDFREGNSEIFTKTSTDNGLSWGEEERLAFDSSFSVNPKALSYSHTSYLVWQDNRDGDWEIYFKAIPDWISGDVDGSCSIALSDVIYLANYLLKGGPSPDPTKAGDVDCNSKIELADVIYLANYLLSGGPQPCPNFGV